jgi:hypothetical protein
MKSCNGSARVRRATEANTEGKLRMEKQHCEVSGAILDEPSCWCIRAALS